VDNNIGIILLKDYYDSNKYQAWFRLQLINVKI
jgi:hypothetical protein